MLYVYLWNRLSRTKKIQILVIIPLILLGSIILGPSNPYLTFTKAPSFSAEWEIVSFYNNHIGGRIEAILKTTSVPGVRIDLSQMPKVGEVVEINRIGVPLNEYYDPYYDDHFVIPATRVITEGELEIQDRQVNSYLRDGLVVTEVYYDFQYLLPIDFNHAFNLKVLPRVVVRQIYLFGTSWGEIQRRVSIRTVEPINFYLARRVDQDSTPIFQFNALTSPLALAPFLRLAGAGIIAGAVVAQIWILVWGRVRRNRAETAVPDSGIYPIPTLMDLYIRWGRTGEYQVFAEAVKLYRAGTWGNPSPLNWAKSTFILYSGVVLSDSQVANYFTKLMEAIDESTS